MVVFFFFQAEDGIRDDLVTGVQTCALPISERDNDLSFLHRRPEMFHQRLDFVSPGRVYGGELAYHDPPQSSLLRGLLNWMAHRRSEERRVGKEWRHRWWASHGREHKWQYDV